MATRRQRSANSWEYVVRRKGVLGRPLYLSFSNPEEGDAHVARLEALLDRGIVPEELRPSRSADVELIGDAIREYLVQHAVALSDRNCLGVRYVRIGDTALAGVDYEWVEAWISGMKRERNLSPSTIRHYVGALARCFDWAGRRGAPISPNPLRLLPKRYATYSEADAHIVKDRGRSPRVDAGRERRLEPAEEKRIRAVLAGEKPAGKQRALADRFRGAQELLFDLALETGMHLREIYTLGLDQVDLKSHTIFLERTKNGDKRQVPLSSVARAKVRLYLKQVRSGERGMDSFTHEGGRLFPWWDGDLGEAHLNQVTARLSR